MKPIDREYYAICIFEWTRKILYKILFTFYNSLHSATFGDGMEKKRKLTFLSKFLHFISGLRWKKNSGKGEVVQLSWIIMETGGVGWDLGIWLENIWFNFGGSHEQINMNGLGIERRWRSLLSNSLQISERQRGERKAKVAAQTRRKKERRDRKKEGGVAGFLGTVGSKHYASYARDNFLSLSLPSRCTTQDLSLSHAILAARAARQDVSARATYCSAFSLSPLLSLSYSCCGNSFPYTAGFGALCQEYWVHCIAVQTCARTHALSTSFSPLLLHAFKMADYRSWIWLVESVRAIFLSLRCQTQTTTLSLFLSHAHAHTLTHSYTCILFPFFFSFLPALFFLYYLASDFLVFRAVILKITFFNLSIFHVAQLWS